MRLKILVLSTVGFSACSGGSGAPGPAPSPVSGGIDYDEGDGASCGRNPSGPNPTAYHISVQRRAGGKGHSESRARGRSLVFGGSPGRRRGSSPQVTTGRSFSASLTREPPWSPHPDEVNYRVAGSTRELQYAREYYVIPGQLSAANAEVVFGGPARRPSPDLARLASGKGRTLHDRG